MPFTYLLDITGKNVLYIILASSLPV